MLLDRSQLFTEQRLAESMQLDEMSIESAVALMNAQNALAVEAVGRERQSIARAIELIVRSLRSGGRLLYVGAGTSGRLGVLDATECPPTFRTDPSQVQGIIAGGEAAMFRSQEGAEDSPDAGAEAIDERNVTKTDAVMGIAAGGTTPFVHGALRCAAERGASTLFLCCVQRTEAEPAVDVIIRPVTGPEVVTGSTRLKAGTATKLVLNAISTIAMVQLGKVYENLMVDLRASNQKLRDRATRIVADLTRLPREPAAALLDRAQGHVKLAVVMHFRNVEPEQAGQILDRCQGILRRAIHPNNV